MSQYRLISGNILSIKGPKMPTKCLATNGKIFCGEKPNYFQAWEGIWFVSSQKKSKIPRKTPYGLNTKAKALFKELLFLISHLQ